MDSSPSRPILEAADKIAVMTPKSRAEALSVAIALMGVASVTPATPPPPPPSHNYLKAFGSTDPKKLERRRARFSCLPF